MGCYRDPLSRQSALTYLSTLQNAHHETPMLSCKSCWPASSFHTPSRVRQQRAPSQAVNMIIGAAAAGEEPS